MTTNNNNNNNETTPGEVTTSRAHTTATTMTTTENNNDNDDNNDDVVLEAKVVAMFPPRPDAIMTILHSDEYLPGVQTLLYSIKKTTAMNQQQRERMYPPEIVVCITSNVTMSIKKKLQSLLVPANLCTRIILLEDWPIPLKSIDSKLSKSKPLKRTIDDHNQDWTKLQIFGLQQYDTILYIDSDCLVIKDITSLLDLNKIYTESEALIAAVPDILPPDKFNSGVIVIRPSLRCLQKMKQQSTLLTTYDQSDTGFLNAYFSNWFTDMPPSTRLPIGYNAQQVMFDITCGGDDDDSDDEDDDDSDDEDNNKEDKKNKDNKDDDSYFSNFWDVQISGDLYIIHYSNPIKPWQEETATTSLVALWKDWHRKSKTYLARHHKEAQVRKEKELKQQQQAAAAAAAAASMPSPPPSSAATASMGGAKMDTAKAIKKRYKELRKQGLSTKDAMDQARDELLPQSQLHEEYTPSQQVAAMFGMM